MAMKDSTCLTMIFGVFVVILTGSSSCCRPRARVSVVVVVVVVVVDKVTSVRGRAEDQAGDDDVADDGAPGHVEDGGGVAERPTKRDLVGTGRLGAGFMGSSSPEGSGTGDRGPAG
jgi:hypothetical protein